MTAPAPIRSLTEAVGKTPLVRLRSLEPRGVEIHAKLEWFNPGGSVKDRAALRIIEEGLPGLRGFVKFARRAENKFLVIAKPS